MMERLALCLLLASITWAASDDTTPVPSFPESMDVSQNLTGRIVGGRDTSIADFPHQCSMRHASNLGHFCGCSILSNLYIMTAAHCVFERSPANIKIVTGSTLTSSGGSVHSVSCIKIHLSYDFPNDDLAILKLANPIELPGPNRKAIILPPPNTDLEHRQKVFVTGWGRLEDNGNLPDNLQKVKLRHIKYRRCLALWNDHWITEKMICAKRGQRGICNGDSGGPLVIKENGEWVQYGVVSFVSSQGCTARPGVYMKVSAYIPWIKTTANLP